MAATIQAQPPKPPPAPPQVEAAPKADPKPAAAPQAAAQAAPAPAKTPDLFEQASGGGRLVPSSGGSSFTPAASAANANTIAQAVPFAAPKPPDLQTLNQISASQSGFGGAFNAGPATSFQDFSQSFTNPFDSSSLGGLGNVLGGGPATFNLPDTFSKNFGGPSFGNDPQFLIDQGGGSKPGIGSGFDFLNQRGSGALPTSSQPSISSPPTLSSQPSISSQLSILSSILPSASGSSSSHGHHFGFFNFGSQGSGGGGATGGVAERWGR